MTQQVSDTDYVDGRPNSSLDLRHLGASVANHDREVMVGECPICQVPYTAGGSCVRLQCVHPVHEQCYTNMVIRSTRNTSNVISPCCRDRPPPVAIWDYIDSSIQTQRTCEQCNAQVFPTQLFSATLHHVDPLPRATSVEQQRQGCAAMAISV